MWKTTKNIFLKSILTSVILLPQLVTAAIRPVKCSTNFGEKSFTIDRSTVSFHQKKDSGRSISSVLSTKTRKSAKGFNKTLYQSGNKHLIHIENQESFNSDNDFLAITSPKGHKMTFPINCRFLE